MMEFWLSFQNNAERFQLPVNPGELSIGDEAQHATVNVSKLGEVSIIQDPALKTVEFSTFFPAVWGPYCAYREIPDPREAYARLVRWKNSGWPVRFIVTGTGINMAVTIERLDAREAGGDVGTIYVNFSLREYRFIKPRRIDQQAADGASSRPDTKPSVSTYTVKSGDSLWKIARLHLGDGRRYPEIATLNGIKPPYTIYPGDVLQLPA